MVNKILFALSILIYSSAFAQDKLTKDIDFDGKNDKLSFLILLKKMLMEWAHNCTKNQFK